MSPQKPTLQIEADLQAVQQAAARHIVKCCQEAMAETGSFLLALSGGQTPGGVYRLLAQETYSKQIEWRNVHIIWGDERYVPHDDEESCYWLARTNLLDHVPIPSQNIYPIPTHYPDPHIAANNYALKLAQLLYLTQGTIHLALQGMGADGHTASLFPHHPALDETNTLAVAVEHAPKPPLTRISLTATALNKSRHILFVVTGEEKATTLCEVLTGANEPHRLPAQLLQWRSEQQSDLDVTWIVDKAAASQLPAKTRKFRKVRRK